MNDHHLPSDELASAFLDGELAGAETDAVRQDPELAARADALRQAAEAVAKPVDPPPGAADAAVQAALADFDARRSTPADIARERPRRLAVITGVAAAVAIGFIVAAAVGLFAEREDSETDTAAAPSPAPAAAAASPEPPPEPPAPFPPPAADAGPPPPAMALADEAAPTDAATAEATATDALQIAERALAADQLAQATAEGNQEAVAAAEAEPATAQAAARAEASAAQAEADGAREAAAQSEAAAAPPLPADPPPPASAEEIVEPDAMPPDDGDMGADDMGDYLPTDPCAAAVGDRTVELRLTLGGTPIIVLTNTDGSLAALNSTTCAEIPAEDPTEAIADAAPDGCAAAVGDRTVELRLTLGGTPIIVLTNTDGSLSALNGTTCAEIPAG